MTWSRAARTAFTATVVALAVVAQVLVWTSPATYEIGGRPLNAAVAVAYTLPALWAARWPLVALLMVLGACWVDVALDGSGGTQWFAVLLCVYALGRYAGPVGTSLGLLALAAGVLAVDVPRLQDGDPVDEVLPGWFILAGTWGLGRWMAHRRREMDGLAARADALARDQEQASRAAVAEERARIARELHDLVAHALAAVVLQAQAADRVLDSDPAGARRALGAVATTGRQGLVELRRMLDVLVDVDPDSIDPHPGLDQLEALAARVREAGLPVTLRVEGVPRPLPVGVDLSAYRIVQEALTNVLKHAGTSASATVDVCYRPDAVVLDVRDDGRSSSVASAAGRGLVNMRERAQLFGGTFRAGPLPERGFAISAVLPTGSS